MEPLLPRESIKIAPSILSADFANFGKEIDLAEPLGTETQLFFKLQNKEIISRMYNPRPINVGEKINFQIDENKIHFFDYETKKAI